MRERGATEKGGLDRRPLDRPARGGIFGCNQSTMATAFERPWLRADGTILFARKPVIEGAVTHNGQIEIEGSPAATTLRGNGLPTHPTGAFPVERNSEAGRYDANPT